MSNETNQSQCVDIEKSSINDFLMSVYILAFILGLIFNLLTLHPILQQVRQKNVLGVFLLCLSVTDLLFTLTMPLWINYYNANHHWGLGPVSCSIAGFFYYSNMYISIYLLCCISVDRCLVVCYPLHFKTHRKCHYAWLQCGIVYVTIMAMHIIVLIYDNVTVPLDDRNDRCYETYPMQDTVAIFNLIRVGIGFFLPLIVLAVSYWRVLATVGRSPGLNAQTKRKVRLLSFGVIGIFSVCFAPYHILLLIRSLVFFSTDNGKDEKYCNFEEKMHIPFSVTLALSSLNSVMDPVLYVLVSNLAQDTVKMCCRRVENTQTDSGSASYKRGMPKDNYLI